MYISNAIRSLSATFGFHEVFYKQQSSDNEMKWINRKSKNTVKNGWDCVEIYMYIYIYIYYIYIYIYIYISLRKKITVTLGL